MRIKTAAAMGAARKRNRQRGKAASDRRSELAVLVDERRRQRAPGAPPEVPGSAARRTEVDPAFAEVFARFEAVQAPPPPVSSSEPAPAPPQAETPDSDGGSAPAGARRRDQRPALAELKALVPHPELIQWYDCDAQDPHLLVHIKASKNVVPVPAHWQTKREYLSGRSLLEKRPFELPDVIKQTDIESMRNALSGVSEDKTLKQEARARVQPKMGRLDLDYVKLHDAFFKLGRNWRPDIMLQYGDMYYENRNLDQEAHWTRMRRRYRPGRLSLPLRKALGLAEGRTPVWCKKWKEVGLPPGYPGFKVAGINWDMSNLRADVYGEWKLSAHPRAPELFGSIVSFETDHAAYTAHPRERGQHTTPSTDKPAPANDPLPQELHVGPASSEAQEPAPVTKSVPKTEDALGDRFKTLPENDVVDNFQF
ncbi:AFR539Cp [Eremothecium gossypii ATCC 10895]|uniref:AFR539Cp n=1 Tax=Eremothecium gossypii (strain ATCC 10895 / CBS 109.51 / FGSC 9923 / NRRL Y-1056) TaxID=284811 RepID=Q752N5_EREGS|nr:AFR539Cp [Eremothecium gossypii ATCC 10895]AAS53910.1 AFR539Cp [Eremothecium gossypii ATCC 10895]